MQRSMLVLAVSFVLGPCAVNAAEVKNLRLSQSGENAVATYDLEGKKGEKSAEVAVSITIGTDVRSADKLKLTGDFGKKVKIGKNKKILWKAKKDLPNDFDGDINWDIRVVAKAQEATPGKPAQHAKTEQAEKGPALEETLKFIKNRADNNYTTVYTYVGDYFSTDSKTYVTNVISYEGCKLTETFQSKEIRKREYYSKENGKDETKEAYYGSTTWFMLEDLDPASVSIAQTATAHQNIIPTSDKSTSYHDTDLWNISFESPARLINTRNNEGIVTQASKGGITVTNKDAAERISRALKHAVQLCSKNKKKELF